MRRFVINSLISYFTELEKKMKSTVVTSAMGVFLFVRGVCVYPLFWPVDFLSIHIIWTSTFLVLVGLW